VHLKAPAVMDVHSECYNIGHMKLSYFGAAGTTAQIGRSLREQLRPLHRSLEDLVLYSQSSGFIALHNPKALHLSYLSLLQSQDSLHHKMACIIYLGLSVYIHIVYLATDSTQVKSEEYLETPIE